MVIVGFGEAVGSGDFGIMKSDFAGAWAFSDWRNGMKVDVS